MKEVFEESLRLSRDADDKWGIADALLGLGSAIDYLDDRERGKELFQEGIGLARELGYAPTLARFLLSLGYTLLLEGDYERGAALNEEAVAVFRERGYKARLRACTRQPWVGGALAGRLRSGEDLLSRKPHALQGAG